MKPARHFLLALFLPLAATALADTVYKWIEPDGSITFSSTPPPEGEAVEELEALPVAPPPSEVDRQEADRRVKAMRELATEMERDRKARAETARSARVIPPAPMPAPVAPPPPDPLGEKLVFDDWWTGPARPGESPPAAPAPEESRKPFFTPGPAPAFH
jgi:hypothetical protein